jgi:hypothetical protein
MTFTVTTTDITPGPGDPSAGTEPVTIVTEDLGDGTSQPVTSVVDVEAGESSTIQVAEDAPTLIDITLDPPAVIEISDAAVPVVVDVNDEPPIVVEISEAGSPGPPGIPGPRGPQGTQGPSGGGAEGMTFTQDIPSTDWVIPHGWTYWPSVTVIDSAGNEIDTEIYQTLGVTTVHTVLPTAGRAYLI